MSLRASERRPVSSYLRRFALLNMGESEFVRLVQAMTVRAFITLTTGSALCARVGAMPLKVGSGLVSNPRRVSVLIQSIEQESAVQKAISEAKPDAFEVWLAERPRWLQTAANRLITTKAVPNEKDLAELADLCSAEAGGLEAAFSAVTPGALAIAASRPLLRIEKLSEVRGVNRIKDHASLDFGSGNLAAVYGENGSGKSGFSRVLKQACGSRSKEDIHTNIFSKEGVSPQAVFHVSIDGQAKELNWTVEGGPLRMLRDVHVFDSMVASNYVGSPNEAHYEPSRMRFISQLIRICGGVSEQLKARKLLLSKKLPLLPPTLANTQGGKWVGSLRATTPSAEIERESSFSDADDAERIAGEGVLVEKNPATRQNSANQEKSALVQVLASIAGLKIGLSDERLGALISARSDAAAKRLAANEAASKMFANAPLEGVAQQTWMALWEQAGQYAQMHAYPGQAFPNVGEGALCVLCQQPLDGEGKSRLSHFSEFVLGGLEKAAKDTEKVAEELANALPKPPTAAAWAVQASVLKFEDAPSSELLKAINARLSAVHKAAAVEELPLVDWGPIEECHKKISASLDAEIKMLVDLQADGKRKQLEERVAHLRAAQWLNQNKASVVEEVERLKQVSSLEKADALTSTTALTKKHTELSKDELHKGYQDRFAAELASLGGKRIPVRPESRQQGKGKVTFGIDLYGAVKTTRADSVLSEGEARVVALAAFLADVTGADHGSPFIFDDPISSLDQGFEERVVKRLVALSMTRQVIIFTHRLSLLTLLEGEFGKLKAEAEASGAPAVKMLVRSVRSFGAHSGIAVDMSIRDMKPKNAVNRMRQDVATLRKLVEAGDIDAFDVRAKALCSDLRILVERCVENVLLNDVLVRFRRDVQTKGRIGKLANIQAEDCALLDELMTRYSVFEHSQADELPAEKPDIDEIEQDVKKLEAWIAEFSER